MTINPIPSTLQTIQVHPTGPFAPNTLLQHAKLIPTNEPEAVFFHQGRLHFTSPTSGCITRQVDSNTFERVVCTGGQPLGAASVDDASIYVADAQIGLLLVDTTTKGIELVLPAGTDLGGGVALEYPDDVAVGPDGMVYVSNACSIRPTPDLSVTRVSKLCVLGNQKGGKIVAYNPATGAVSVLIDDLYFANGLAVAPDGQFLLSVDSITQVVNRYWLQGEK